MLRGALLLFLQLILLLLSAIVSDVIAPTILAVAVIVGWFCWFVLTQMNWWDLYFRAL